MHLYRIHPECPEITKDNWNEYSRDGWRWEGNVKHDTVGPNETYLEHLQLFHGPRNVTIGECMEVDKGPCKSTEMFGVYVRNVDEFISSLTVEIYEWGVTGCLE